MKLVRAPAVFELIRPHNCLFAGIAVLIGAIIAAEGIFPEKALFAFLAAAFISGAGYAVNDYSDRKIDRVNRPWRPIPSGRLGVTDALMIAGVLFVVGISFAAFVNLSCLLLAGFNSFALALYASELKRRGLVGNLAISYLVGSTFLFGGLAVGELQAVGILAAMAGLSTMGRELIKDIEDMSGDRKLGLGTFPIRHGMRATAALAVVFTLAAITLSPVPYLLELFDWTYLGAVAVSIVVFLVGVVMIAGERTRRAAGRASFTFRLAMGLGLLAFLVGALS
ncbi:MAG: UbiA family prenyltransferase [Candidatus Hadarchaeota archaeon]|nr:UbiA family prenyltransferase [Candidatus Hadarchaeota archaeon]